MLKVKSNLNDNRCALWQVHPDHPGGEVFVAGDAVVEVAETAMVKERLKIEWIVEVEPAKKATAKAADKK